MKFKNNLWAVYNKERQTYDNLYAEMIMLRDQIYEQLE